MEDKNCPNQFPGFTHNGDCNLICKPTEWKDIMLFFLGNYGAHAATVIGKPGQSTLSWAMSILLALCFPGAGVLTGVQAISSLACFAPTELTKATRAGALCMVIKPDELVFAEDDVEAVASVPVDRQTSELTGSEGDERTQTNIIDGAQTTQDGMPRRVLYDEPRTTRTTSCICRDGICVSCVENKARDTITVAQAEVNEGFDGKTDEIFPPYVSITHVNGLSRLPSGYRLLVLPEWVTFENDVADNQETGFRNWARYTFVVPFQSRNRTMGTISSSYNILKILISIGQLIYAAITLYDTRGNQIAVYGYAAFGLTVAPYIWMSMVNLLGNLICPQYPTMFLVNSPTLDELREKIRQNGMVDRYTLDSTVGRISKETQDRVIHSYGTVLRGDNAVSMALEMFHNANTRDRVRVIVRVYIAYAIAAVPIVIVGAISSFKSGKSKPYQRVWTMLWLCLGPMVGTGLGSISMAFVESRPVLWRSVGVRRQEHQRTEDNVAAQARAGEKADDDPWWERDLSGFFKFFSVLLTLFTVMYMIPAIGGFVVVGKMLNEYGTCMKTD